MNHVRRSWEQFSKRIFRCPLLSHSHSIFYSINRPTKPKWHCHIVQLLFCQKLLYIQWTAVVLEVSLNSSGTKMQLVAKLASHKRILIVIVYVWWNPPYSSDQSWLLAVSYFPPKSNSLLLGSLFLKGFRPCTICPFRHEVHPWNGEEGLTLMECDWYLLWLTRKLCFSDRYTSQRHLLLSFLLSIIPMLLSDECQHYILFE